MSLGPKKKKLVKVKIFLLQSKLFVSLTNGFMATEIFICFYSSLKSYFFLKGPAFAAFRGRNLEVD